MSRPVRILFHVATAAALLMWVRSELRVDIVTVRTANVDWWVDSELGTLRVAVGPPGMDSASAPMGVDRNSTFASGRPDRLRVAAYYSRGVFDVTLPYWLIALLFGTPRIARVIRRGLAAHRRRHVEDARARHMCPTCGYDLRATPDRCPECGTVPPPATTTTAQV